MNDEEDDSEHDADKRHDEIRDGEKVVLASHPRRVRQNQRLGSLEGSDWVVVIDGDLVHSRRQPIFVALSFSVIHASIQLSEIGQRRGPHPHDKVLVLVPVVVL